MNNRSIHFWLVATTVFSSGIFVSSSPADAHSFDECVTVQQEVAEEVLNGTTKRQLRQKYGRAFRVYEASCDGELEANGFITLKELKKGTKKKNSKAISELILNGRNTELDLNSEAVQIDQAAAKALDNEAEQVRQATCAQVSEERRNGRCLTYRGCVKLRHNRHHTHRLELAVGSERQDPKPFEPIG